MLTDMEAEHPLLQVVSSQDNEANMFNTMSRLQIVPTDKVTHRIIAFRQTEDKTYFTIKTSTNNLSIVKNILNGNAPGFSIRTKATFEPDQNGVQVATKVEVLGIDYVANPANASSVKRDGRVRFIDPVNLKHIDMEMVTSNMSKIGCESVNDMFLGLVEENTQVYADMSASLPTFVLRTPTRENTVSFEATMRKINNSIL